MPSEEGSEPLHSEKIEMEKDLGLIRSLEEDEEMAHKMQEEEDKIAKMMSPEE